MPRLLFIYPKLGHDVQDVSYELPMNYLCVAAPLLARGFEVSILDQRLTPSFDRRLSEELGKKPLLAGLSIMTGKQILHALDIAQNIRKLSPRTPLVFGGVHASLMPDQTLENPLVDIIVRFEGEDTVPELAECLLSKGDLQKVKGLSFREDGHLIHTPDRDLVNLNAQPDIPYHLVPVENYLMSQIPGCRRSLDVYTSRGCPCTCTYCYNQSFNKRRWRPMTTDRIIKNIRTLIDRYKIDSIFFNDDNMFVNLPRVYEICEAMASLPYIPVWGSVGSRIDALKNCNYDILEKSGCKHLYIGIESGSDHILHSIKKGISLSETREVVRDISRTGIIPHYNFMTGFPEELPKDLEATLAFIDKILEIDPRAYISSLHIATPYPGTPYFFSAQEYGWKPPGTLEGWANIYWERTGMPWLSSFLRRKLSNISIISYFIDHKVADRLQGRKLFLSGVWLFNKLAKFRWEHRQFTFCPEFQLLKRLNEWAIIK